MDEQDVKTDEPLEVTIKKEKSEPSPDFDYDDYTPSDTEILEIEKEIQEKIVKRTKPDGK